MLKQILLSNDKIYHKGFRKVQKEPWATPSVEQLSEKLQRKFEF